MWSFDHVLQKNGDIELAGPGEYRQCECMERAEMLSGNDVRKYLEDVDETARGFYVSAKRRGISSGYVDAIDGDGQLLDRLSVYQKSKSVWIAVGEYMGERIETKGPSEFAAVKH